MGYTDSNSREWPQDFLCFSQTYYFSSEHKPLFILIGLCFIKRHVWRAKMFHKTINKAWNLFNLSEQSLENFPENPISRFLIHQKLLSIDRMPFSIGRTRIEQRSRDPKTPAFFLFHFWSIEPKLELIENIIFEFWLRKF